MNKIIKVVFFMLINCLSQPQIIFAMEQSCLSSNDGSQRLNKQRVVKKKNKSKSNFKKIVAGAAVGGLALAGGLYLYCGSNPYTGLANLLPANPKLEAEVVEDASNPKSSSFTFYNLKSIQYRTEPLINPKPTPAFNIICCNPAVLGDGGIAPFVKIDEIIKNPLNAGAVIQFASNDDPTWLPASAGGQARAILDVTVAAARLRNAKSAVRSLGTTGDASVDIDNILIGLHKNVSVEGGAAVDQKVNLSLVAARSGAYKSPHTENCQQVAYEGTLLSAAGLINESGAPKVFLTMMGGNIFASANPLGKIIDAIENAVNKYVVRYGLNVTLICWRGKPDARLAALTEKLGGYICTFDQTGIAFKPAGQGVIDIEKSTFEERSALLFGSQVK